MSAPASSEAIGRQVSPASPGFPLRDRLSFLWLVVGFALLAYSNGFQIVPIAAWLGPIFMVRFLRTQRALPGLVIGYVVNAIAFYLAWNAAFQDAGAMFTIYTAVFGLVVYLPFAFDRLLRPHVPGFASTLLLPVAWVVVEYACRYVLPLGTFFNVAYTQSSNLPLLQVMTVTGLWGVSFLVIWLAGVVNYAWEGGFEPRRVGRGVLAYAVVLALVLVAGGARVGLDAPMGKTVQVAVLTTNVNKEYWPDNLDTPFDQRLVQGTLTTEDRQSMSQTMAEIDQDLLTRTQEQARHGSKIVTWSEYNAGVFSADESAFLDRARQVAREGKIYLAFPLIVVEPDPAKRPEPQRVIVNKSVMITPEGEIAYQYVKHNLLIGWEIDRAVVGPAEIKTIDTPYGRLTSVICLDMEFPDFMRMAGQQGVDIVLSGAIDGTVATKGNPLHSYMASYRTIEEGFSLARAGIYGQSVAVDYQGRVLAASNYYTATDRSVVAFLPIRGARTIYTQLGDFLPLGCIVALVGFVVLGPVRVSIDRRVANRRQTGRQSYHAVSEQ